MTDILIPDGVYVEAPAAQDADPLVAAALIAGSIPVTPPKEWFGNPKLTEPTPIQVTDDGRVFGHIAAWDVDHIGMPFGTRPPKSRSNYRYFHTGVLRTADGDDVTVGQLTLAGGHAPLNMNAAKAAAHYDDTGSACADVHAGEDVFGIWVAGSLRPNVTAEQVRVLRASAPSGDWRPIRGALELVAVCQVNVPGFPIARAQVASGMITALVAAGSRVLAEKRLSPMHEFEQRLSAIERPKLEAEREAALLRVKPLLEERRAALVAAAETAKERVRPVKEQRMAALIAAAEDARARVAALKYRSKFEEELHPRDDSGRFKDVLFRLQQELQGRPGTDAAIARIQDAQEAEARNDAQASEKAANDAVKLLDAAAEGSVDPEDAATIRQASKDIATAIAYLPLPFQNQADHLKWSDVPPAGQAVLQNLLDRAKEVDSDEARQAVAPLANWMAGGDFLSQAEIDQIAARLVRALLR